MAPAEEDSSLSALGQEDFQLASWARLASDWLLVMLSPTNHREKGKKTLWSYRTVSGNPEESWRLEKSGEMTPCAARAAVCISGSMIKDWGTLLGAAAAAFIIAVCSLG